MEIKILGTGCSNCKNLEKATREAVAELNLDAAIVKEEDIVKIMSYGIMRTPALVLDGYGQARQDHDRDRIAAHALAHPFGDFGRVHLPDGQPAAAFIAAHRREIVARIAYWTGEGSYVVRQFIDFLRERSELLGLNVRGLEASRSSNSPLSEPQ